MFRSSFTHLTALTRRWNFSTHLGVGLALFLTAGFGLADPGPNGWRHEELQRFSAAEAHQGVAVSRTHFFAISNRAIGKYRKDNGLRVTHWEGAKDGPIIHLNAGVVVAGKLFCAHSNYPQMPVVNSIEVWDTATLRHLQSLPVPSDPGSLTWAVPFGKNWLACFAHYKRTSDPALSRVALLDARWQPGQSWRFPTDLIAKFGTSSSSGGAFGPGSHLFVSGHDATELYVLDLPKQSDELSWLATVPISAAGQAFAWDPYEPGLLYSVQRKTKEVIVSRVSQDKLPTKSTQ